jgi:hypothetical protein
MAALAPDVLAPPERSLLRACLLDGDAAISAFRDWQPYGTPGTLDGRNLRLMPLLYGNLQRLKVADPVMPWLRGLAKHVWLISALRQQHIDAALAALEDAGLPVTLIKGAALLARWPEEMATRPMGDFDLLVPCARVREALAALRPLGWGSPEAAMLSEDELRRGHAVAILQRKDIMIDVHWQPAAAIADPAHGAAVTARATPGQLGARAVALASLADHLFILLAHAFHNLHEKRFDWVAEAGFLLRQAGAEVDWDLFRALARRYRLESWVCTALQAVESVTGTPVPPDALPSAGRLRNFWQRREIAAHGGGPISRTGGILRAYGDATRGADDSFHAVATNPGVLAHVWRARGVQLLLPPGFLLRAFAAGDTPPELLGQIGPKPFLPGEHDAGASRLVGWSITEAEGIGRWTDGNVAWLLLRTPGRQAGEVTVRLDCHAVPAAAAPAIPRVVANIWLGKNLHRRRFDGGLTPELPVELSGRILQWRGEMVLPLFICFLSPLHPKQRGFNIPELRSLGLFVRRIEIL